MHFSPQTCWNFFLSSCYTPEMLHFDQKGLDLCFCGDHLYPNSTFCFQKAKHRFLFQLFLLLHLSTASENPPVPSVLAPPGIPHPASSRLAMQLWEHLRNGFPGPLLELSVCSHRPTGRKWGHRGACPCICSPPPPHSPLCCTPLPQHELPSSLSDRHPPRLVDRLISVRSSLFSLLHFFNLSSLCKTTNFSWPLQY